MATLLPRYHFLEHIAIIQTLFRTYIEFPKSRQSVVDYEGTPARYTQLERSYNKIWL